MPYYFDADFSFVIIISLIIAADVILPSLLLLLMLIPLIRHYATIDTAIAMPLFFSLFRFIDAAMMLRRLSLIHIFDAATCMLVSDIFAAAFSMPPVITLAAYAIIFDC